MTGQENWVHEFTKKVGEVWCQIMHDSPMWPIHGEYQCRKCMRRFPVPWEAASPARRPPSKTVLVSARI